MRFIISIIVSLFGFEIAYAGVCQNISGLYQEHDFKTGKPMGNLVDYTQTGCSEADRLTVSDGSKIIASVLLNGTQVTIHDSDLLLTFKYSAKVSVDGEVILRRDPLYPNCDLGSYYGNPECSVEWKLNLDSNNDLSVERSFFDNQDKLISTDLPATLKRVQ